MTDMTNQSNTSNDGVIHIHSLYDLLGPLFGKCHGNDDDDDVCIALLMLGAITKEVWIFDGGPHSP